MKQKQKDYVNDVYSRMNNPETKKTIKYNTETTRTSPKPEMNPGAGEVWAVPTSYKTFEQSTRVEHIL